MMSYSQTKDVANTVSIPSLVINNAPLSFYKLDDGVMGGQSQTHVDKLFQGSTRAGAGSGVVFAGTINTNGGGFTSIRSSLDNGIPPSAKGLKLKYRGDGKTYKILLSDGKGGGPFSSSPSWQCDLPTTTSNSNSEVLEESDLLFKDFLPSFGGRSTLSEEQRKQYSFVNEEMRQIGLMLSLKLSNGVSNPVETFGSGIFDFKLEVDDIELI